MRHDHMRAKAAAANNYKGDLAWHLEVTPNEPITVDETGVTHVLRPYSEQWSQGGPIIEREGIEINVRNWSPSPGCRLPGKYEWSARLCFVRQTECKQFGPTPLIAAMRCYVASKLGDEVDIPEELLK